MTSRKKLPWLSFLEVDNQMKMWTFRNRLWKTGVLTHHDVSFCGLHGNAPWLASSNVGGIDVCHILDQTTLIHPKIDAGPKDWRIHCLNTKAIVTNSAVSLHVFPQFPSHKTSGWSGKHRDFDTPSLGGLRCGRFPLVLSFARRNHPKWP